MPSSNASGWHSRAKEQHGSCWPHLLPCQSKLLLSHCWHTHRVKAFVDEINDELSMVLCCASLLCLLLQLAYMDKVLAALDQVNIIILMCLGSCNINAVLLVWPIAVLNSPCTAATGCTFGVLSQCTANANHFPAGQYSLGVGQHNRGSTHTTRLCMHNTLPC